MIRLIDLVAVIKLIKPQVSGEEGTTEIRFLINDKYITV